MGRYALQVIEAPAAMPLTLWEAKAHLRVDGDEEDNLIDALLRAAVDHCASYTDRCLTPTRFRLSLDCAPTSRPRAPANPEAYPSLFAWAYPTAPITVPVPPLLSVEAVKYVDADGVLQTMDPASYYVDTSRTPGRIFPTTVWPELSTTLPNALMVEFTAGHDAATLPPAVRSAVLLMLGHLHRNREAVITGTITAALPLAVEALLMPHRVFD